MICLIPGKKLFKKIKSIITYTDIVIVNSTTDRKIRDLPNVFTDITTSDEGMRTTAGLDALAFQINSRAFDESVSERTRNSIITAFFLSADFQNEFVNICAYQVTHPNINIYIALEDKCYDNLINQFLERFDEMIDAPKELGTLIFSWNSAKDMQTHVLNQIEKQISGFDKEAWMREKNDMYNSLIMDDLEDDDYDRYLDAVHIKDIMENPESNREIRELFFRYGKYTKKQLKALGKFVKDNAEPAK
jgi:hypothetical protein